MKHMVLRPNRSATPLKTLHIAADFGTTFSASAYAKDFSSGQTFSLNHIKAVTGWPDGDIWHGRDVTEVPTELVYEEGKRHPVAWGWEARNMMRETWRSSKLRTYHLVRFKLLLSRKDDSKNERREILEILARDGRSVIDVIVDFLTPFREHILKHIQRGMEDDDEYQSWAHQWTLSVPADWTPLARRQMLEAAEQAGFNGVVKLISEPEASGLYMIETEVDDQLHMTLEDAVVVGDLGGGTIDCATYLIAGLNPLSMSGLASVSGRICGSGDLNLNFRRYMRRRLEHVAHDLQRATGNSFESILDRMDDWFEAKKKNFRGPEQADTAVPIPHLQQDDDKDFLPAAALVSSRDLDVEVFEPVIKEIIDLLSGQVHASTNYRSKTFNRHKFRIEKMFLTGGLAGSPYVFDETAVVRGAVWRSLYPDKITKRVSETSYGFKRDESYVQGWSHGGPEPVKHPMTGAIEMKDRMKWAVKRDDVFKNNDIVSYRLERYVPVGGSLAFQESMFFSDTISEDHVHCEHPDIHFLGDLTFDLEKWRKRFDIVPNKGTGVPYMMIEYLLVSIISEDNWSYEIEVLGNKTNFKGSSNIAAGLKLSQGSFSAE